MPEIQSETANSGKVLPLKSEFRRLFFELGTVAANNFMGVEALFLFNALEKCEPQEAYPKVGLGMVHMLVGNLSGAKDYLTRPEAQNSRLAASANAMLALVHKLDGNESGFAAASLATNENSDNGEFSQVMQDLQTTAMPLAAQEFYKR